MQKLHYPCILARPILFFPSCDHADIVMNSVDPRAVTWAKVEDIATHSLKWHSVVMTEDVDTIFQRITAATAVLHYYVWIFLFRINQASVS